MKYIIGFPLLSLLLILSCGRSNRVEVQQVEFYSADSIRLKGSLFSPAGEERLPGVIFCHMYQNNRRSWEGFARKITGQGFIALTFDFRAWGESGGDSSDIPNLYKDVMAGAEYLSGCERVRGMPVVAVGASMGGMAAVEAVARDTVIKGVVTISAPHLWQGSEPIEVVGKISPRPLLVIAADKDPHLSVRAARLLYLRAGDPREWLLIGATRHGTDIFATDQKRVLERAITDFLLKYFKPQKPAKS